MYTNKLCIVHVTLFTLSIQNVLYIILIKWSSAIFVFFPTTIKLYRPLVWQVKLQYTISCLVFIICIIPGNTRTEKQHWSNWPLIGLSHFFLIFNVQQNHENRKISAYTAPKKLCRVNKFDRAALGYSSNLNLC